MDIEQIILGFNRIQGQVYDLIREDDTILGDYLWLQNAIKEEDIQMDTGGTDKIYCFGSTYSTQTVGFEWFEFTIPMDRITL